MSNYKDTTSNDGTNVMLGVSISLEILVSLKRMPKTCWSPCKTQCGKVKSDHTIVRYQILIIDVEMMLEAEEEEE